MSLEKNIISEWTRVLHLMIENHRQNHPEEMRSDQELILSILEYCVQVGVVRKEGDKYVLSRIVDPQALARQYSSHKN
jgi:hypothetical protein